MHRDPRVDAYIAKSAQFAQPILTRLRIVVHSACPDVEETVKWGMPAFMHQGLLCSMAAFQEHCTFGFWKGDLIVPKCAKEQTSMGQFGRLTSLKDLPSDVTLRRYVREAVKLNENGVKVPRKTRPEKPRPVTIPPDLQSALRKNAAARANFEKFSPSQRREYVEWITEAKRPETRKGRLQTTVEWVAEGKIRNWKYIDR